MTPSTMRNATSGMPVFLKNASPATPENMTTPAASSSTCADAMGESGIPSASTYTLSSPVTCCSQPVSMPLSYGMSTPKYSPKYSPSVSSMAREGGIIAWVGLYGSG